jgi:hypothetical protein
MEFILPVFEAKKSKGPVADMPHHLSYAKLVYDLWRMRVGDVDSLLSDPTPPAHTRVNSNTCPIRNWATSVRGNKIEVNSILFFGAVTNDPGRAMERTATRTRHTLEAILCGKAFKPVTSLARETSLAFAYPFLSSSNRDTSSLTDPQFHFLSPPRDGGTRMLGFRS